MKFCAAAMMFAIGIGAGFANTTDPVIFNYTLSIKPGQVLGIQGDNFGVSPQVWVQAVTSTSGAPTPTMQLANVLTKSASYIAVEFPGTMSQGMYAIFLRNTAGGVFSAAKFVNQPYVNQALDLAGTQIDANRTFRLAGRNLQFSGASAAVQFKKVNDGTTIDATVVPGTDPYLLTIISPPDLVAGQDYDLLVSNGYGGTYGTVTGPRLTARSGGTDYFGLNVPWAADFNFYANVYNVKTDPRLTVHAAGNGITDDEVAIRQAMLKASAAGGGVVYLPAGTYLINAGSLWWADINRVVLKGDGIDLTNLYSNVTNTNNSMFSGRQQANTMSYVGFVDLTAECGTSGPSDVMQVGGSGKEMFVLRCKFITNKHGGITASGVKNMLIQDSYVIQKDGNSGGSILGIGQSDVMIRGNYFQWHDGRMDFYSQSNSANVRFQFENNLCRRSIKRTQFAGNQFGGPSLGGAQYVALLNNTFNRLETDTNTPLPKSNDGETLLNENINPKVLSIATGSTDTTLVDSTKNWTGNFSGFYVTIIQGPGMGQTRTIASNTTTSLILTQPWDVNPTPLSYYVITIPFDSNYLIKGNLLQEVPRGIWICYGGCMSNIAIVGNQCIDTNGIYLRGDTRPISQAGRFNVQKDILIEGNTVTNTRNWYPAQIVVTQTMVDGTQLYGNPFYNVVVRDNTINGQGFSGLTSDDGSGCGEGYYARQHTIADNDTAGVLGVIFDHNGANNLPYSYHLNNGSYQTTIWNSVNTGFDLAVADGTTSGGAVGATHPSVDTVVGPASPYGSDIIVDNTDTTGVTVTGSWTSGANNSGNGEGFYGVSYLHDGNAGKGAKSVRFTPVIPAPGIYRVYTRWIAGTDRAASVPVSVTSTAGTSSAVLNEKLTGGQWMLVGTYSFNAGTGGSVLISTTGTSGYVIADAVRFVLAAAVPTGAAATAGNAQANLSWAASGGASSYNIKRATTSGGPYTVIGNVSGTSYTDTTAVNGTNYYYVISAVNGSDESGNSSEVNVTPMPPPSPPTGASATAGDAQVALSWVGSSGGPASYNIKRATRSGGPYTTIANPLGTSYTDTGVSNGTTYYYVISATNGGGESANSAEVAAMPAPAWSSQIIGTASPAGSFGVTSGVYTISAAGAGLSGPADNFRFTYTTLNGDGSLTARVATFSDGNTLWKVAGVMIRQSLDPGAMEVSSLVSGTQGAKSTRRLTTNGSTIVTTATGPIAPYWVRITRVGSTITAYRSLDGVAWTSFGSQMVVMSNPAYIGFAVSASGGTTPATATFDNVSQ